MAVCVIMRNKLKAPILLKNILIDLAKVPVRDDAGDLAALQAGWKELAGETLYRRSHPMRLHQGRLIVGVAGSSWANEFQYSRLKILEKIRQSFPHLQLEDIRCHIAAEIAG